MNAAKRLFHVFALLSLCMQLTAHLSPVFAEINGNWQITICSFDSIRTVTIDENGKEVPQPNMRMHDCAFCANTDAKAIEPKLNKNALKTIQETQYKEWHKTTAPKLALKKAHNTRAPPHLS